jgi:hypothetical protein
MVFDKWARATDAIGGITGARMGFDKRDRATDAIGGITGAIMVFDKWARATDAIGGGHHGRDKSGPYNTRNELR